MSDLVIIHDDRAVTDSRIVAEMFGKRHKNVLRTIDRLISDAPECGLNFEPTSYEVAGPRGSKRFERYFEMDRDGFMLLVMGFTGVEALRWKLKFIAAFNTMEQQLRGNMLTYAGQQDMVKTIGEIFGPDDALYAARKYGWPVRRRTPRRTPENDPWQALIQKIVHVGWQLAQIQAEFAITECAAKLGIDPRVPPWVQDAIEREWLSLGIIGRRANAYAKVYRYAPAAVQGYDLIEHKRDKGRPN